MDLRRVRTWEWLTGVTGIVLLVSLFLPWYKVGGESATAWESLTVVDVILAFGALCAIALPIVTASQRTPALPQAMSSSIAWVSLIVALLAVIRLIKLPDLGGEVTRAAGVWIGTIASLALVAFDIKAMRDKHFPAAMRPRLDVETLPAPAADGTRSDVQ